MSPSSSWSCPNGDESKWRIARTKLFPASIQEKACRRKKNFTRKNTELNERVRRFSWPQHLVLTGFSPNQLTHCHFYTLKSSVHFSQIFFFCFRDREYEIDLVGAAELDEAVVRIRMSADIRVVVLGQIPIRRLELRRCGRNVDLEHLVKLRVSCSAAHTGGPGHRHRHSSIPLQNSAPVDSPPVS